MIVNTLRPNRQNAIFYIAVGALSTWAGAVFSQNSQSNNLAQIAPFDGLDGTSLNANWKVSGLPNNKAPLSQFQGRTLDGQAVLSLESKASYGVLTHAWQGAAPPELSWRWRLDQALTQADIQTKAGDDAALKVCVMFDQPLGDIPFFQRSALGIARAATGQNLPSATLCYLWDNRYPAGTHGANPYSGRVRYVVLNGPQAQLGQWVTQLRRVAQDFALMFGQETQVLPRITAIAVGADSDNTHGNSLGYIADLRWLP